jgi:MFS family permease
MLDVRIWLTRQATVRTLWAILLPIQVSDTNQVVSCHTNGSGFIRQFGTVTNADGQLELAAIHVSLWSGFQYVGQIVFQAISPFISDRFGRRIAMYVLLILMLTVS